jgi:predicted GNAT family N-acyltransferase
VRELHAAAKPQIDAVRREIAQDPTVQELKSQATVLHAQAQAVDFYRRAGFAPEGAAFEEAGVAHQAMRRAL